VNRLSACAIDHTRVRAGALVIENESGAALSGRPADADTVQA